MKTPLRLAGIALGVGVVFVFMAACDIDGDTYGFRLVNHTQEPMEYQLCSRNCETFFGTHLVEPGESKAQSAIVGQLIWWQIRDEEGQVLGCLKFDYDRQSAKDIVHYVSKNLDPCP